MGTYTIQEVKENTYKRFRNRFEYMKRDVLKRVTIKEQKVLSPDRSTAPSIRYIIQTESYPQYLPYFTGKDRRGRTVRYQRSFRHEYDIVLTMDRLSLNTRNWKMRVGSTKIWNKNPPQSKLKKVDKKTRALWKKQLKRRFKGDTKKINAEMKKKLDRQYQKGDYLSVGDYNAMELGINADFIFMCSYVYHKHGHHYGRNYYGWVAPTQKNEKEIMFFTKHGLRLVEYLTNKHILKDN